MDYITISILSNANNFGNLLENSYGKSSTSNGINNRGITSGGNSGISLRNVIEYIDISTIGNAQDFGDLSVQKYDTGSTSNA